MTYLVGQEKPSLEDLAHHGVKGMKWGVRKDRTSSSSKAGSNDAAPVIAVGALYAGMILAALAAKTKDSGKINQLRTKNVAWKTNPTLMKKMSIDDLHTNVVKPINSDFGAKGTKMNCRRCTFAYEMRRRGLDVKATTSNYATGQDAKGLNRATGKQFSTNKPQSIWGQNQISSPRTLARSNSQERSAAIFDALSKHPNGARGELGVGWQFGGGHSMAWEVVGGKPVIFDTQSSVTYRDSKSFEPFARTVHDAAFTRLDTLKLDDSFMRKWAQNA